MRAPILLIMVMSLAYYPGQNRAEAAAASQSCGGGDVIVLPTIRTNTAVFVDVMVNDTPGHFLIDTGAERTSLKRSFFQRLGLQGGHQKNITINGFGGTAKASGITIRQIRAGELLASDVDVTILDDSSFEGIIGLDLLSRYDVEFDIAHNRIALHSQSVCPGQKPNWGGEIAELRASRQLANQISPSMRSLNLIYITAELNGQPALALLDTGNGVGTTVNPGFAEKLGISAPDLGSAPFITGRGVKEERSRSWVFKDLVVAHEDVPSPRLLIATSHGLPFELNLGFRYFSTHRVWIDFLSNRVFIAAAVPQAS